jgi:ribosome-associated protein
MININSTVSIPEKEVIITAARSSGPGGQNVNKVSTKVMLRFDLEHTEHLTETQKKRARKKIKNRINKQGFIVLHEEEGRTQAENRRRVIEKFALMMAEALTIPPKRVPTRVSRAQKERRLDEKKTKSRKKIERKKVDTID